MKRTFEAKSSGLRYAEIITDFSDELFLDLTMTGHCGRCAVGRVAIDTVPGAFANEDTAMRFYVPDEVGSFHLEFKLLAGRGVPV